VEYACGLTEHMKGGFSSQVADGVDVHSIREPVGVVAAITPFNFPIMVPLWMTANAIATGNAVILKPSERDHVGVRAPSANFSVRRGCRVVSSTCYTATPTRQLAPRAPGHRRGELRRLDAGRATCTSPAPSTESASRRSAVPRTTWSSCPTPISISRPTLAIMPGSARPGNGVWRSASSSGRRHRR